jgi:hypothetical protein
MADDARAGMERVRVWSLPTEFEFEGCTIVLDDEPSPFEPGDLYLAGRNTGPHLLTVRQEDDRGWVVPVENVYCFDTYECRKVLAVAKIDQSRTDQSSEQQPTESAPIGPDGSTGAGSA